MKRPIRFEPWQKQHVLRAVIERVERQLDTFLIGLATKNGKSTLAAVLAGRLLSNEPLRRGNDGKPHWAEFCYRTGGETVYVCSRHPNGVTEASYTQWEYFLARRYDKFRNMGRLGVDFVDQGS